MRRIIVLLIALCIVLTACGGPAEPTPLRVLAHDFFVLPDQALADFEARTGLEVEVILGGDAGLVVNQAILAAGNPVADVIFGVDTTLLSRALDADLFDPYVSGDLVTPSFGTGDGRVTPIDFGDVCLNYDTEALATPPGSLEELTERAYAGMLVVPDPRISSPGLAFLLATIDRFGEDGAYTWRDYWADLRSNDVEIASDWGSAYYGSFSGAGTGTRPIVVSYASSPPAEVLFSDPPIERATTAVITDGCFRQVEYVGILRGSDRVDAARQFIDFLLSAPFQESVATTMFVFPVDPTVALPQVFRDNTTIPVAPASMDPARIELDRERRLTEWTDTVLR